MKINSWQLSVIIGLVIISITLCIIYLIANRGSDKVIELSFKSLLIPVFVALGLILLELFKPLEIQQNKMVFCTSDNPSVFTRLVSAHQGLNGNLHNTTMDVTTFYSHNRENLPYTSMKNKIEIAEILILHLISKRYSQHWQIDFDTQEPFFGGQTSSLGTKIDADKKVTVIDENLLHQKYHTDHLIQNVKDELNFIIPKETSFSVSGDDHKRVIFFNNKYLEACLSIEYVGSASLPHVAGKEAALIRKRLNLPLDETYLLNFDGFTLNIEIKPKRFLKWNPETLKQIEWFKEIFEYIEGAYGWSAIIKQLEQNLEIEQSLKS